MCLQESQEKPALTRIPNNTVGPCLPKPYTLSPKPGKSVYFFAVVAFLLSLRGARFFFCCRCGGAFFCLLSSLGARFFFCCRCGGARFFFLLSLRGGAFFFLLSLRAGGGGGCVLLFAVVVVPGALFLGLPLLTYVAGLKLAGGRGGGGGAQPIAAPPGGVGGGGAPPPPFADLS